MSALVQPEATISSSGTSPLTTHDGPRFRVPGDLEVTPTRLERVLLVGQCILNAWAYELEQQEPGLTIEHILFNFTAQLPDGPSLPIDKYNFQIVALPLRGILHESKFLRLSYLDTAAIQRLFDEACDQMALFLRMAMKWNTDHSLLSFVMNFLVPQQNPNGRLMPRYDLRNLSHFVERLNERLAEEVSKYTNAYLFDCDQVSASIGRRYVQDDSVCTIAHGSVLANFADDKDQNRIEPPKLPLTRLYNAKVGVFIDEVWREAKAMYRTVRQIDPVKMVIVDLDDTLWRGVLAEQESVSYEVIEGWPLGIIEALAFLKKRGVILGIVSKNEESNVARIFEQLLRHRLPLDSFALKRINWLPKSQNIAELIGEANLLPRNVVFVDDNPVERASVAAVFPDLRIIGADPYAVKRVLLWSPETQVAVVTNESARRSEMIQAQVIRETARKTLSREEFLDTLDVQVKFITVTSTDDVSFARAFELLNKTNQFNTTGKRWSLEEINRGLEDGLQLVCFFVEDKFTEYGLVGVVLLKNSEVLQYVMSCRVLGLDVEKAVLSYVAQLVKASGGRAISAKLIETAANFPCRKLYSESGFAQDGELWQIDIEDQHLVMPAHIRVDAGFKPAAPEPQVMSVTKDDFPLVDLSDFKALQIEPELKFPSATLERGSTYSFSDPSPAWLGEAIGIGHRENWGFWTIDDRATLTFAVKPSIQEPIELLMRLRPFLASEKPEQAMRLVINGFPVSRWVFKGKLGKLYDIRFRIPATYLGSDGHIALTFEFGNPTSPRQLGISDDPRRLGAGLLSISVAEYA